MSRAGQPERQRLSRRLEDLAASVTTESVTLAQLVERMGPQSHVLLTLVLTVPFLQPIPLPVVSTLFGVTVVVTGAMVLLEKPLWLPRRLGARCLSAGTVRRLMRGAVRVFARFEHLVRPRIAFFHAHPGMRRLSGAWLLLAGVLLSLPLPIPASNFLPALTIALLSLGHLEDDGLLVILGYIAGLVTCAFFVALGLLPWLGVRFFTHAAA